MTTSDPVSVSIWTALSDQPIRLIDHEERVVTAAGGAAGAIVGFSGAVRDHDGGRGVRSLSYSSHPTAPRVLEEVVAQTVSGLSGVRAVAVSHRVGDLVVGDVAFVVAVAADHRAEGFTTCARVVDEVKARLPVWKHQHFADGSDEWVGSA